MERERPELVIEAVGRRIAELRQDRGWTQEEAAERLGISLRHMKRIEAGYNFTIHSLVRLAAKLGVPTIALLTAPRSWAARHPGRPSRGSMGAGAGSYRGEGAAAVGLAEPVGPDAPVAAPKKSVRKTAGARRRRTRPA